MTFPEEDSCVRVSSWEESRHLRCGACFRAELNGLCVLQQRALLFCSVRLFRSRWVVIIVLWCDVTCKLCRCDGWSMYDSRGRDSTACQFLELRTDAIGQTRRSALVNDADAVLEDRIALVDADLRSVALGKARRTFTLGEVADDERVVRRQSVNGKRRPGHRIHAIAACGHIAAVVHQAVRPQDESGTVYGGGPPRRTDAAWHAAHETEDLAAVEDGFLTVGDAALVQPHELLEATVCVLATCETLYLGEVCYGVETDQVEQDEVALHHGAHRVGFEVAFRQVVPALHERLHFFEASAGGCGGQRPSATVSR